MKWEQGDSPPRSSWLTDDTALTRVRMTMHNTRLFPKFEGAAAYHLTGIAKLCDWAIMTDLEDDNVVIHGETCHQPRSVFLSLRSFFKAIPYFYEEVLPRITTPFVFITGSEDLTVPNQVDTRWRPYTRSEKTLMKKIIEDERVIHWFAENRDEDRRGMSSLPVGFVFMDTHSSVVKVEPLNDRLADRPLKMLCAHRTRPGRQWEKRRSVTKLCEEHLKTTSTVLKRDIPPGEYYQLIRQHPFVLCVRGGGLDPSPKAWECIANGSIPIIESSTLDDAYTQLPVALIEEWSIECLNESNMRRWIKELAPFYENPVLRRETLRKLSLDFWWQKILDARDGRLPGLI